MSRPSPQDVETIAFAAHSAGLAVLPPREDGTKAPMAGVSWTRFQECRPDFSLVSSWYASARHGVGVICGRASGGQDGMSLNVLDFDDGAIYAQFVELAQAAGFGPLLTRIEAGYAEATPAGGRHLPARCPGTWPTTKLAERPDPERPGGRKTLIETKCEGGYIILAPSHGPVHPSGQPYQLLSGGLDSIAEISAEEWTALCDLAASLDEMPTAPPSPDPRPAAPAGAEAPGDRWAAATSWAEFLGARGWRSVFRRGDTTYWRRPGKDIGVSATTNHGGSDLLYCFSTSTPFEPRRSYTKFGALACLDYGGDYRATARALVERGFGPRTPINGWHPGRTPQGEGISSIESIQSTGASSKLRSGQIPLGGGAGGHTDHPDGHRPDSNQEWTPPRLKDRIVPVPFPIGIFPSSLSDLCRASAASMQCPSDYFGAAALGLAGGAIGLSVALTVKPGYVEAANLYLGIVGPPGSKKTPALKRMAGPLFGIDRGLREEFQAEQARHEEALRVYQASRRGGGVGPPPVTPVPVQLTIDDSTVEGFAVVHSENPRGLTLILDEMTAWVAGLNAYRQGKGADKQFWLKCNSGSLVKINRKSSRIPVLIPQPCATIVGCLTPSSLPAMRSDRRDDGWMDRILLAYPDPLPVGDWDESVVPQDLLDDWDRAIGRLWRRPMLRDDRGRPRPFFVGMTEEAKALWREWVNAHRAELRAPDFPRRTLAGPWSKLEGFVARIALILAQLHHAYDPTSADHQPAAVGALDVWGARQLADYFKVHFRRARQELVRRDEEVPDDAQAILDWILRHRKEAFTEHDIRRHFPRFSVRDRADALGWLLSRGFLRPQPRPERDPGRPGRLPSPSYDVNPYLGNVDCIDPIDEIPPRSGCETLDQEKSDRLGNFSDSVPPDPSEGAPGTPSPSPSPG